MVFGVTLCMAGPLGRKAKAVEVMQEQGQLLSARQGPGRSRIPTCDMIGSDNKALFEAIVGFLSSTNKAQDTARSVEVNIEIRL